MLGAGRSRSGRVGPPGPALGPVGAARGRACGRAAQISSAGSSWTRTAPPSLRGLRVACAACRARARADPSVLGTRISARTGRAAASSTRPAMPSGRRVAGRRHAARREAASIVGNGPQDFRGRRKAGHAEQFLDRGGGTGDGGHPDRGRERQLLAFGQFAFGVTGRIPADQRLDHGDAGVGVHDHVLAGPDEGRGVEPFAQRLLRRPQARPPQQRPPVEQQGGRVAVRGDRLGARRRHHHGRLGRHAGRGRAGHRRTGPGWTGRPGRVLPRSGRRR